MPITTITFDVWETIFKDQPDRGQARSASRITRMTEVMHGHGLTVEPAAVDRAYRQLWERLEKGPWAQARDVNTHDQLALFVELLMDGYRTVDLSGALLTDLDAAYVEPIFAHPPVLVPGLPDVLARVRSLGYRTGVVCNTGVTPGWALRRLFGEWGILEYFESLAFSNEIGRRKPDPSIFQHVLAELGVEPAEAVHIGDNLVADIHGAKQAGMRAVLVASQRPTSPPAEPDAWVDDVCRILEVVDRL